MGLGRRWEAPTAAVAVVGAAEAQWGAALPGLSAANVMAQASLAALADAGLDVAEVDGVFAAATQLPWASVTLSEELGITPRWQDSTMLGGASPMAHVNHARAAIAAGQCEVALIAYGSTQRLVGRAQASVQEVDPWEAPYAPPLPVAAYALAASRHMHEYGTTAAAGVGGGQRAAWAQRRAAPGRATTSPSRTCGRAARLRPARRARLLPGDRRRRGDRRDLRRAGAPLRRPPVFVLGAAEAQSHRHMSSMPDLGTAAVESGARAFAEAGLRPGDVESAQLYDAFTITPILFWRTWGSARRARAGRSSRTGRSRPAGRSG